MIFLEATGGGDPYFGILVLIVIIIVGLPIILGLTSIFFFAKKKNKTGKILLIISGVYLLVSLGICSSML